MNIQHIDIEQIDSNPDFQIKDSRTERNRVYYQKRKTEISAKRREKMQELINENERLRHSLQQHIEQNKNLEATIQQIRNLLGNCLLYTPNSC